MTKTAGEATEFMGGIKIPRGERPILAVKGLKDHPCFKSGERLSHGDSATGEHSVKHVYSAASTVSRGQRVPVTFSHFLIFISEQWVLVFALLLSLNLLLFTESRKAGPALSPQQAINLTNREGGVFLDVREAKEYKRAHITEAVNIPIANLQGRLGELENYRDKPVIVVCRMGTSASTAVKQLRANGFPQAQRMAGGMMSWDEQRLPVTNK
jgi:rhodanese-related sulfurtransferase